MIHYDLKCDNEHAFDGWFASSSAFETQQERGLLSCPACGTDKVRRDLMAPAVRTRSAAAPPAPSPAPSQPPPADAPVAGTGGTQVPVAKAPPEAPEPLLRERAQFLEAVRALREALSKNATNVGKAFPEEARRIHYGEAEPRGIYGEAPADEARALIEEGVEILPLPRLPEDNN